MLLGRAAGLLLLLLLLQPGAGRRLRRAREPNENLDAEDRKDWANAAVGEKLAKGRFDHKDTIHATGFALVPHLKNWVPLVGANVYDPPPPAPCPCAAAVAAATATTTPPCPCAAPAPKVKVTPAKVVGEIPDVPCETDTPQTRTVPGGAAARGLLHAARSLAKPTSWPRSTPPPAKVLRVASHLPQPPQTVPAAAAAAADPLLAAADPVATVPDAVAGSSVVEAADSSV